jgi:cytoplasmic tRNA 2-thiolation protein 1
MYAYFKKLDYFSTECIYSPDAYRGHARAFLKDLEAARPSAIIDIIHSGEAWAMKEEVRVTQKVQRTSNQQYTRTHTHSSMIYRDVPALRVHVQQ